VPQGKKATTWKEKSLTLCQRRKVWATLQGE
jgi:hypothetical protein